MNELLLRLIAEIYRLPLYFVFNVIYVVMGFALCGIAADVWLNIRAIRRRL